MPKKIICALLLIICIINTFTLTASAASSYEWYVKRNGNRRPESPIEESLLNKYNSYYIDNKLSDSSEVKKLYLTFDSGYENGNTEKILNVLKEKNVPAAFFILDRIPLKHKELLYRMKSEGHTVCNHTKNHKDISQMSAEEIKNNLLDLERIYEEKTGEKLSKYFRFPEGKYSEESLSVIKELGYKTIFWSLAYADWDNTKQPDPNKAMKIILDNTHNGAVILLHPTSETNAKILPQLIDEWRSQGYTFGTLDELTS